MLPEGVSRGRGGAHEDYTEGEEEHEGQEHEEAVGFGEGPRAQRGQVASEGERGVAGVEVGEGGGDCGWGWGGGEGLGHVDVEGAEAAGVGVVAVHGEVGVEGVRIEFLAVVPGPDEGLGFGGGGELPEGERAVVAGDGDVGGVGCWGLGEDGVVGVVLVAAGAGAGGFLPFGAQDAQAGVVREGDEVNGDGLVVAIDGADAEDGVGAGKRVAVDDKHGGAGHLGAGADGGPSERRGAGYRQGEVEV